MTLSLLNGHFPIASFANAIFRICDASRGPSASAEVLVNSPTGQTVQRIFRLDDPNDASHVSV